jgi:hypothetical protein
MSYTIVHLQENIVLDNEKNENHELELLIFGENPAFRPCKSLEVLI